MRGRGEVRSSPGDCERTRRERTRLANFESSARAFFRRNDDDDDDIRGARYRAGREAVFQKVLVGPEMRNRVGRRLRSGRRSPDRFNSRRTDAPAPNRERRSLTRRAAPESIMSMHVARRPTRAVGRSCAFTERRDLQQITKVCCGRNTSDCEHCLRYNRSIAHRLCETDRRTDERGGGGEDDEGSI